jgi:hypothetical protein
MVNQDDLDLLRVGVGAWNQWRQENVGLRPDLRGVNLSGQNLSGADLRGANLRGANLKWSDLRGANLRGANLSYANLSWSTLSRTDFTCANLLGADLTGANLSGANLSGTDLREATLKEANLWCAQLSGSNLECADLTGCLIYGLSAWNLKLEGAIQSNLIITPANEMTITVDNLEVAQFLGLLLQSQTISSTIHHISSQIVLILGDFQRPERVNILNAIRDCLRRHEYLPVVFDFQKQGGRDLTPKILRAAGMAKFVIAEVSAPKTIPQELEKIVSQLPSVPVQPIIDRAAQMPYNLCESLQELSSVLKTYYYDSSKGAIAPIAENIIVHVAARAKEVICN